MAIKIVFPTPESVPHSGGQRLLEIEADALDDLKGLSSRVDDGVRTFYAAPGSMARAKDGSAVYEYSPAGEWVPQGSGDNSGPSEVVILPETVLTPVPGEEGWFSSQNPLSATPTEGATAKVEYNGAEYECSVLAVPEAPFEAYALGNVERMGIAGGNADAPFLVMLMPSGAEDGSYTTCIAMDEAPSVTLSIVQVGAASGGSGNADSVLTITADMSASLVMSNISTAFADAYEAVTAGRQVRLLVNRDGKEGIAVCTLGVYSKAMMFFYCMPAAGTFWSFTFNDDDTMTVKLGGN